MKQLEDGSIIFSKDEAKMLRNFIDESLDMMYDKYTDFYPFANSYEEGKKKMHPAMYDIARKIEEI